MAEKQGKTRKSNWEAAEKLYLIDLVGDEVEILERKRNDFESTSAKNKAWLSVQTRFRARYGDHRRELREIKEQWKRLKLQAKSEWSAFTRKRGQTGGGPPPQEPSKTAIKIKRMMPQEFLQIANPYDDDAVVTAQNAEAVTALAFLANPEDSSSITPGFDFPLTETIGEPSEPVEAALPADPILPLEVPATLTHPQPSTSTAVPVQRPDQTPTSSLPSASTHLLSSLFQRSTPTKRHRARTPSPAPTTQLASLQEDIREWARKEHEAKMREHEAKMRQLDKEHELRVELLQLEKELLQKRLDLHSA